MSDLLRLGISTCPNDTFAFHALLEGEIDDHGFDWQIELADVEELNQGFASGRFDCAKLSFASMLPLADELVVLPAGSALGFGVGPVVLARPGVVLPAAGASRATRVLAPGAGTTANLLWRLFHGGEGLLEQRVFHALVPALVRGEADFCVCIHEARFTYAEHGLQLAEDLGARWEQSTGLPLPLGGIAARRSLGPEALARCARAVRASLDWARAHPQQALSSMRRHAQEQRDEVLWKHVELYVNEHTLALGPLGARALAALGAFARIAASTPSAALEILGQTAASYVPRLFHLAPLGAWRAFEASGAEHYEPAGFQREGCVHLSHAPQLAGSLARHLAHEPALVLMELERSSLGSKLQLEPVSTRGAALFPHLLAPIARHQVVRQWILERDSQSSLPRLPRFTDE